MQYTYKFLIYKFQLVLPWCTTLGSEVKVQLKAILTQHDLKPQAVTCQLWTLKISILSNPFQFILHLSIARKERKSPGWVTCGISRWFSFTVLWARTQQKNANVGTVPKTNLIHHCVGLKNFTKTSNSTRAKYAKKQCCIKTESTSKLGNFNSGDKSLVTE